MDVAAGLRCHGCRTVGHAASDGLVQVRVHVEAAARHEDHGQHGQAEQQRQHARHQTHPLAPAGCCISLSQCPLQPQAPCQPQLQSGYRRISYKLIAPSHRRLSLILLQGYRQISYKVIHALNAPSHSKQKISKFISCQLSAGHQVRFWSGLSLQMGHFWRKEITNLFLEQEMSVVRSTYEKSFWKQGFGWVIQVRRERLKLFWKKHI